MSATPKRSNPGGSAGGSPFDLDLGGGQRDALRAQVATLEDRVAGLAEDRRLKELRIEALHKMQKQETRTVRVARWQLTTLGPVFGAWSRAVAVARTARASADSEAQARAYATEKDTQVKALIDRLATVKSNATAKLSGLSEANRKLAAALEEKDKGLV
eukprot:3774276-Prymnesium_polylepis.1